MKKYLKNLRGVIKDTERQELLFFCEEGNLTIRILNSSIIHFLYSFNGIKTEKIQIKASNFISEPELKLEKTFDFEKKVKITENSEAFVISFEKLKIKIGKKTALVSILKNGVLQHGGSVGNEDTVVPSYQLRIFRKNDCQSTIGRFDFALEKEDEFYGLGDKSGYPNRNGNKYQFFNRDSMGYDAEKNDPLYKSIPFFIKRNGSKGSLCGILFDQTLIESMDFGRESRLYYSITSEEGPFSYYYFDGNDYKEILDNYLKITGRPLFPPLFSFGFLGSSMNYVEEDDAQQRILDYFEKTEQYGIPSEGMYVSSGYLKHPNGRRYAFIWNKKKFPDPKAFVQSLAERGYKLCMNIKPGILTTHPWYGKLAERGYFIKDLDGNPYVEFYWGGDASYIDFSNPEAFNWWKTQLKEQFLDYGCEGIWNDNNEFEIEDIGINSYKIKSILTILMCKASFEAIEQENKNTRPWICSRSGYAGIQRYARTWSGDNCSDWKTLKFNQYMSIGLGLSGIPFYGHDLGGFFGNRPEEELLIRSCESAVLQPRFVIHSWREDGKPTEPWSYKGATPKIKHLIKEHYRFMPYIYNCGYQAVVFGQPMDRSLHLEFPDDENFNGMEIDSMFGNNILKVLVVDKNVKKRIVYLPKGENWYHGNSGKYYRGGSTVEIDARIGTFNWFAKTGSIIPFSNSIGKLKTALFSDLELKTFPEDGIEKESLYFEDDGSAKIELGKYNLYKLRLCSNQLIIKKIRNNITSIGRKFTVSSVDTNKTYGFNPDKMQENDELIIDLIKMEVLE